MTTQNPHQPHQSPNVNAEEEKLRDPRESGEMPFLAHLEELRKVLFTAALGCVIGAAAGWWLAPFVLENLIARTVGEAIILSPLEAFNERIKLTLLLGLVISAPFVFYRIWLFIVPGLMKRERGWVLPTAMGSMLLFLAGVAAAYFYVVPIVIEVLSDFMTPSMNAQIRVSALLGMTYSMAFACGIICQMPLVMMMLTAVGIVTPGVLLRQWRYAIVGSFALTAVITPGDVVTAQIVMALPMTALYFLSVGLSWMVYRTRAKRRATEEEALG